MYGKRVAFVLSFSRIPEFAWRFNKLGVVFSDLL
jgi:hypothetical protein